ncbi:MAG: caspase family protein [Planctomycetaceae bacterium]
MNGGSVTTARISWAALLVLFGTAIAVAQNDPPVLPAPAAKSVPADPPTLKSAPSATEPPSLQTAPVAGAPALAGGGTSATVDENSPELVIDAGGFLGSVAAVAISPDNRLIAASGDKIIRVISTESGEVLKTLRGDRSRTSYGNVNGLAFSPDGRYLVAGIHDDHAHGSIRLYRTDRLDEIDSLLPGLDSPCSHVVFSRDGRYLATVDGDGQIVVWDWPNKRILKKLPARNPDKPIIDALAFADTEPFLLSVEHDGPHVYRIPDGTEMTPREYMPPKVLGWMFDILQNRVTWPFPMANPPRNYEWKLDQNLWLAAGVGTQNSRSKPWVGIWDARTMNPQAPAATARITYTGHKWEVYAVAMSSDRRFVVSGDKFGEVHIWDAASGTVRHRITSQGHSIYNAAFTADNDRILFSTQPDLSHWGFNSYGIPTSVLDLNQRTIRKATPGEPSPIDEQASGTPGTASIIAPAAGEQSYHVAFQGSGQNSRYRIPSGRIPSCFTVLNSEKLGVAAPVLFADNLGLLAMWNTATDEMRRAFRGHESMITSISPSPNGKIFVTGSTDRTIRIWSLLGHTPTGIFDFKYENTSVIRVDPGSSSARAGVQVGDRIVSVDGHTLDDVYEMMLYGRFGYRPGQQVPVVMKRGDRQFTYQMTMSDGFDYVEPLLNVFIGDNDQWIIWTPQGYYDCSPGADQLIGWHVNQGPGKSAKFFQVQQFRKQLYRPDIISNIISTGLVGAAEDIAAANRNTARPPINFQNRNTFDASLPPVVKITAPADSISVTDPRIDLQAAVSQVNALPITAVTLLHNGTPARVFRPTSAQEATGFQISHRLRLFPGRNEIALIAENSSATSAADDCRIVLDAPAAETRPQVHVLSIGIASYLNGGKGVENLTYAADDAKAFAEAVGRHSDGRLYGTIQSKLLLNENATRNSIQEGLQWLVDNVQQGDVVMLFCSAHGFLDDRENFYLATHEVNPDKLRSTAVSWREIVSLLHEDLPACRRLVFLDACHAEGIGASGAQNPLQELAAPELGTVFYASCTIQQKSFEREEWRHGAFTRAILDVLSDRKIDFSPSTGDGLVSTVELATGVSDKVSTMTGDRQNPVVYAPDKLKRLNILEFAN